MKRAAVLLALLFCSLASAEEPKSSFTWLTKDSSPAIFTVENPCQRNKEGCYITITGDYGQELVRISERTGKVTVAHPEKMDDAARQFWRAMEKAFNVQPGCKAK